MEANELKTKGRVCPFPRTFHNFKYGESVVSLPERRILKWQNGRKLKINGGGVMIAMRKSKFKTVSLSDVSCCGSS